MRRYVLRVYVSAKHMTAKVVEGKEGRVVASASSVEHAVRGAFQWGRGCDARAAASLGEVLAMRLKTEAPEVAVGGGGVHFDPEREIEKKTVDNGDKVWVVVNALRNRGFKVFVPHSGMECGFIDSEESDLIFQFYNE
ncbi:hypothetical protein Fmac_027615 [Flemingia macrophylla]|uniref:Uncharacterized protein n=1 Tax=Flemingia macrophylla TaxID=520843 RepID=A0ABD1LID2_9FABA